MFLVQPPRTLGAEAPVKRWPGDEAREGTWLDLSGSVGGGRLCGQSVRNSRELGPNRTGPKSAARGMTDRRRWSLPMNNDELKGVWRAQPTRPSGAWPGRRFPPKAARPPSCTAAGGFSGGLLAATLAL